MENGSIKKTQSETSNITSKAGSSSRERCAQSIPLVRGCITNHAWISARKKSTEHQKIDHQNRIGKLKMTCPKCGCDQWKLASLIHTEGTSTKSGLVFGSGGSLSAERISPAFGVGVTSETAQTKLAEMAKPPQFGPMPRFKLGKTLARKKIMRAWVCLLLAVLFGAFFQALKFDSLGIVSILSLLGYSLVLIFQSVKLELFGQEAKDNRLRKAQAKELYKRECEEAMQRYEATQVCSRCGSFYIPTLP